jgi:uncharacterized protein YraI
MKKAYVLATAAFIGALAAPGLALAQTAATATTDLNVRAGPGPQHQVIGVVNANGTVSVTGCLDGSKWCQVTHNGAPGWVYSDYLTAAVSGTPVVVTERRADIGIPVVTYDNSTSEAAGTAGLATGMATGAVAGALIGGPVGAAIGGVIGGAAGGATGATAGAIVDPPQQVRTYITSEQVEPVYLDGEVVVGAGLPETVQLRSVPDYEYSYAYINGQRVLVEPQSRRIVYVVR